MVSTHFLCRLELLQVLFEFPQNIVLGLGPFNLPSYDTKLLLEVFLYNLGLDVSLLVIGSYESLLGQLTDILLHRSHLLELIVKRLCSPSDFKKLIGSIRTDLFELQGVHQS